jgi:hypothetical protein
LGFFKFPHHPLMLGAEGGEFAFENNNPML